MSRTGNAILALALTLALGACGSGTGTGTDAVPDAAAETFPGEDASAPREVPPVTRLEILAPPEVTGGVPRRPVVVRAFAGDALAVHAYGTVDLSAEGGQVSPAGVALDDGDDEVEEQFLHARGRYLVGPPHLEHELLGNALGLRRDRHALLRKEARMRCQRE